MENLSELPSKSVEAAAIMTLIPEAPDSNFGRDTDYPD
jgi:hypothetical protein